MNFKKSLICLLALNLLAISLFAQDKPQPVLFDEFGTITEEELLARLDGFLVTLQNEPNSAGYFLSYGSAPIVSRQESRVREYLQMKRFPLERIVLVNGGVREKTLFQLWILPPGADPSEIGEKKPSDSENNCSCPKVEVTGPPGAIDPGESMTFTANVTGDFPGNLNYNWSVDKGTIISGQGTSTIVVGGTDGLEGTTVTAEVSVSGEFCSACDIKASETGIVRELPKPQLIDAFGRVPVGDLQARLDSFLMQMQNDPTATGYFVMYGDIRNKIRYERLIRSYIRQRMFPIKRLVFVDGGVQTEISTEFWSAPAGSDPSLIN